MKTKAMTATRVTSWARCPGILLCIAALHGTASPPAAPHQLASLTPVTEETLTSLRAPNRVEGLDHQLAEAPEGLAPTSDGMATDASATRAIREAFRVPLCMEWGQGDGPRFPFAVEANECLVDALDKLERNSAGYLQWTLLHERIVITTHPSVQSGGPHVMDLPIRAGINANTLLEALEQVEASYNKQHPDGVPLLLRPASPRLALKRRPVGPNRTGEFALQIEGLLREVVLAVLDLMDDPAVCYAVSETLDGKDRHYHALRLRKDDDPGLDDFVSGDEAAQFDILLERASHRLDAYLATRKPANTNP